MEEIHRGLTPIDWLVVAAYGMGMLGLGVWCARRQTSTKDYFTAGGKMGSTAIGISIFATLISTVSYLAQPGEMIRHGPVFLIGVFTPFIAYFVVGYWLIPKIMRFRVTSAYELLEGQLGMGARRLAACMFLAMRLMWMGLMLNICAEALVHMLGMDETAQPWIVIIVGIVAVGYTVLGGLRAVVITDVIQFFLLFGGAVLTVVIITANMGGFSWFPTTWAPHWDNQPLFSWDPHTRVTVVGTLLTGSLWWICTAGSDQTAIQRYMATPDARVARRSFLVNSFCDGTMHIVLTLVGFAVMGFYLAHTNLVPGGDVQGQADKLFPQFIANQLPVGISGLVVVALFAAAMSSVDSGINSVTAVVMTDFAGRFRRPNGEPGTELLAARLLTLVIGVVIVALNTVVDEIRGNYIEVAHKGVNLMVAPLFGLFFMGFFVRWATPFGAVVGTIYGMTAAVFVAFWDVLTGWEPISFQLIMPTALAINIVSGVVLSALPTAGRSRAAVRAWGVVAMLPVLLAVGWVLWLRLSTP